MEDTTGKEKFLKSSDAFIGRVAEYMDGCDDFSNKAQIDRLAELCDLVRVTATSIKALKDGEPAAGKKSTLSKLKSKASDSVI